MKLVVVKQFHFSFQRDDIDHQLKYALNIFQTALLYCREFSVANIIVLVEQHVMIFCFGELDLKIPQEWMIRGILDPEVTAMREIFVLKVLDQQKATRV